MKNNKKVYVIRYDSSDRFEIYTNLTKLHARYEEITLNACRVPVGYSKFQKEFKTTGSFCQSHWGAILECDTYELNSQDFSRMAVRHPDPASIRR